MVTLGIVPTTNKDIVYSDALTHKLLGREGIHVLPGFESAVRLGHAKDSPKQSTKLIQPLHLVPISSK